MMKMFSTFCRMAGNTNVYTMFQAVGNSAVIFYRMRPEGLLIFHDSNVCFQRHCHSIGLSSVIL